jgi:hypothetical protein
VAGEQNTVAALMRTALRPPQENNLGHTRPGKDR